MLPLIPFTREELQSYLTFRPGETRLGEKILTCETTDSNLKAKIALVGIPEDIGTRANMGIGGADGAWDAFLRKFLNIQSNQFLSGESILVAGRVDTENLMSRSSELNAAKPEDLPKLRGLVGELDQRVVSVIKHIHKNDALPIVIGGGHNNSYGCLRGTAEHLGQPLNCLNLDPHADFRYPEGRHSGNGFSYAKNEGYLEKYFVFGLHEAYNSRYLIDKAEEGEFMYITHDRIVSGDVSLRGALSDAIDKLKDQVCGLELDMDGITGAPSSAQTPSGFTPEQARYFTATCMKELDVKYVHIAEGAPALEQNGDLIIGKLISYLVSDICKVIIKKS